MAKTMLLPAGSSLRVYETSFPATENPISEGGNWLNGAVDGLDWLNMQTGSARVYGTLSVAPGFNDPTAIVNGAWSSSKGQKVTTTLYNDITGASTYREATLRLKSTVSAHLLNGYEGIVNTSPGYNYTQIVRWNGALGDFTEITVADQDPQGVGSGRGSPTAYVATGDIMIFQISAAGLIELFINGVRIVHATSTTFTSGGPGIGHYRHPEIDGGGSALNANFGWSHFRGEEI